MEILIAVSGVLVTVLVAVGMMLMTPRNLEHDPKRQRATERKDTLST